MARWTLAQGVLLPVPMSTAEQDAIRHMRERSSIIPVLVYMVRPSGQVVGETLQIEDACVTVGGLLGVLAEHRRFDEPEEVVSVRLLQGGDSLTLDSRHHISVLDFQYISDSGDCLQIAIELASSSSPLADPTDSMQMGDDTQHGQA
eukprot:3709036-Prymnesium_polylepis.1